MCAINPGIVGAAAGFCVPAVLYQGAERSPGHLRPLESELESDASGDRDISCAVAAGVTSRTPPSRVFHPFGTPLARRCRIGQLDGDTARRSVPHSAAYSANL